MLRMAFAVLAVALSSTMAEAQVVWRERPSPVVTYSADVLSEQPPDLKQMYVTQVALHSLDAFTTIRALDAGHREMNPLLKSGNSALIIGTKAAAASASVMLAQKLWKRNPRAAMLTVVITNAMLSAVVANNAGMPVRGR
jgi:hypothetical protein